MFFVWLGLTSSWLNLCSVRPWRRARHYRETTLFLARTRFKKCADHSSQSFLNYADIQRQFQTFYDAQYRSLPQDLFGIPLSGSVASRSCKYLPEDHYDLDAGHISNSEGISAISQITGSHRLASRLRHLAKEQSLFGPCNP